MPKMPSFAIKQTPKGWRVRVPQSISDTGKPQVRYFPARRKAEDFASDLRNNYRNHGESSTVLPPRVADDALRAWKLLEPFGISLTQAAMKAVREADEASRSVPTSEALDAWLEAISSLAVDTVKSYKSTAEKIRAKFGEQILTTITPASLQAILEGKSFDLHRRNASAFWNWCAKPPRRWCDAKIFEDIEVPSKSNRDNDISTLVPSAALALMRAAEKHFPETVATYAIRLFGGVRSEEVQKLEPSAVHADGIEISAKIAKKPRRRFIPMNDTLAAWLEAYPFQPCLNWADKDKAVRRLAGWEVEARLVENPPKPTRGKWPKNVIRHTHASVEIANGATLEDLLFRFGHTEDPKTLRSHYVGRMRKKDALAILAIGPHGSTVALVKTA